MDIEKLTKFVALVTGIVSLLSAITSLISGNQGEQEQVIVISVIAIILAMAIYLLVVNRKRETTKDATGKIQKASFPRWGYISLVVVFIVWTTSMAWLLLKPEPNTGTLIARVVQTDTEINIDGSLNEPAWAEATSLTYAEHPEENGFSTATVRFLWNDKYLYVGFDVNDTQVETADLSTPWDGDSVSVLLHDGGIAEHRQSIGAAPNDNKAYQLKPLSTLNEPADIDAGYTVEIRIEWQETPILGKRIPADLLSVDHDANPGGKYDAPFTIFSKISWDGDGDIASAGASLLLAE